VKIYANQPKVDIYHNGRFFMQVEMKQPYYDLEIPFTDGKNRIELRVGNSTLDYTEINFTLLPVNLQASAFREINVMLGSNRYFEDRDAKMIWIPEKPYTAGSWGYIGGNPVRAKTRSGSLPSTGVNILNTDQDPLFQTQREDLQAFRLDVPDGQYALYLYWANLRADSSSNAVYKLGSNMLSSAGMHPVMNVLVNNQPVLVHFDLAEASNRPVAIIKKILVDVMDKKGITVNLEAVQGKTVLNAIRVLKLN
jgi:beta-galactosidase